MGHQLLATGHSTRTAQIGCSVQRLNKHRPPSRMVKDVGWQPAAPVSSWSLPPAAGWGCGTGHTGFQPWHQPMHHEEGAHRLQVGCHHPIQPGAFLLWKLQNWRPGAQAAACNCFEGSWGDIGCLCSCCHLPLLGVVGSASNPPPSPPVRGAGRFAIPGLPKLLLSVPAGPASALPCSHHHQCQNHYFGPLIREQHQSHLQKSICCCTLCSAPEASKEHTDSPAC